MSHDPFVDYLKVAGHSWDICPTSLHGAVLTYGEDRVVFLPSANAEAAKNGFLTAIETSPTKKARALAEVTLRRFGNAFEVAIPPTAMQVAEAFVRVLEATLDADELAEARREGNSPDDVCDANELMAEAFAECGFMDDVEWKTRVTEAAVAEGKDEDTFYDMLEDHPEYYLRLALWNATVAITKHSGYKLPLILPPELVLPTVGSRVRGHTGKTGRVEETAPGFQRAIKPITVRHDDGTVGYYHADQVTPEA